MVKTPGKIIIYLSALFIVLTAVFFFLKPIQDNDFWWHLKTGQYILETKKLPETDPFSYTASSEPTAREQFILKSFWLSQILLYLSYYTGGFGGVVAFRVFLLTLMFAILYKRLKHESRDQLLIFPVMLLSIIVFGALYHPDRPFILSFLFASVLLWILDSIKHGRRIGVFLPPLMLLWSNSHSGFIAGILIILLYALSEGIKFLFPALNPIKKTDFTHLCLWGAAGIVVSSINPDFYNVIPALLEFYKADIPAYVLEYKSSLYFFTHLREGYIITFYWAMLALSIVALGVNPKKADITDVMVILSFGAVSFFEIRHIAFFVFASGPIIVRYLKESFEILKNRTRFFKPLAVFSVLMLSVSATAVSLDTAGVPSPGQWVSTADFPFKASDFIEKTGIRGNMYNAHEWGGFLIWRFYPGRKVFVDGRDLNVRVHRHSLSIERGDMDMLLGLPKWKALLNTYRVDIILIPLLERSGNTYPLVLRLFNDNDWQVVYYYRNSLVFVRDTDKNRAVINRYAIPKQMVLSDEVLRGLTSPADNKQQER